jgi:hypothetical protein
MTVESKELSSRSVIRQIESAVPTLAPDLNRWLSLCVDEFILSRSKTLDAPISPLQLWLQIQSPKETQVSYLQLERLGKEVDGKFAQLFQWDQELPVGLGLMIFNLMNSCVLNRNSDLQVHASTTRRAFENLATWLETKAAAEKARLSGVSVPPNSVGENPHFVIPPYDSRDAWDRILGSHKQLHDEMGRGEFDSICMYEYLGRFLRGSARNPSCSVYTLELYRNLRDLLRSKFGLLRYIAHLILKGCGLGQ